MGRADVQHWEVELDGIPSAPVVGGDAVYVGTTGGDLDGVAAIDVATGVKRWHQAGIELPERDAGTGLPAWTPVVRRGFVYAPQAGDTEHSVVALGTEEGLWEWYGGDFDAGTLRPAVDDDVLVAAHASGIAGLDPRTGDQLWTYTDHRAESVVRVGETTVLASSRAVHGVRETDGILFSGADAVWSHALEGPLGGVVADEDAAYVAERTTDGADGVLALVSDGGPEEGTARWRWDDPAAEIADLSVVDDTVYALQDRTADPAVVALDAREGRERWRIPGRSSTVPPVAAARDTTYVGTEDGVVLAVDAGGSVVGRLQVGPGEPVRPAVVGDVLVVASEAGVVAGIDRTAIPPTEECSVVADAEAGPTKGTVFARSREEDVDGLVGTLRDSEGVVGMQALSELRQLAGDESVAIGPHVAEAVANQVDETGALSPEAASLLAILADRGVVHESALAPLEATADAADGLAGVVAVQALEVMAAAGVARQSTVEVLEDLSDATETRFAPGVAYERPPADPGAPGAFEDGSVALLDRGLTVAGDVDPPKSLDDLAEVDDSLGDVLDRLVLADVDVVVARDPVDEAVAGALAEAGVLTVDDVGVLGIARADRATDAEVVADPGRLTEAELGTATVTVEDGNGGRVVVGEGASTSPTDVAPRQFSGPGPGRYRLADEAERALRRVSECLE